MSRLSRLFEKFRPAAARHDQPGAEHSEIRWIVMGLGNPGEQYRRSRHNLGFMAARRFATRYNSELTRRKFNGFYTEVHSEAGNGIVAMPSASLQSFAGAEKGPALVFCDHRNRGESVKLVAKSSLDLVLGKMPVHV